MSARRCPRSGERKTSVPTCDNPQIGGTDLHYAAQCRLENVVVFSTGVYNVQAFQPMHGKAGLVALGPVMAQESRGAWRIR